jgi:quercetin dioxygenase-like cupin family protein
MTDAPHLLGPGEGEDIGGRIRIKCISDVLVLTETAGSGSTEPHIHHHHADGFRVLEGELTVLLGDEEHVLRAGDFALAPPELVHCYRTDGARWLNFHAPGCGFEEWLRRNDPEFDQHDPPADGGRPASDGLLRRRGEGDALDFGPGNGASIKAGADDGLGSLALIEFDVAPGFPGPVPHRHERMTDSFYVLEGTLAVRIGEEVHQASARSFATVPPGNVHTFSNPGDGSVRLLNVMAPGGLERYLREVAEALTPGEAPDRREMAEIASRYDFIPA